MEAAQQQAAAGESQREALEAQHRARLAEVQAECEQRLVVS